ncbi:hypothetical protein Tco_1226636 [Tanacetum coccineum]
MNPVAAQQVALDNALVALERRLKIEKCNARIEFSKPQREETYQVTFLITAEVPKVYMHQFWNTIKNIKDTDAYRFKLDKKKFRIDTEVFRKIIQIYPRLPNQVFVEPSFEEEMVPFIQELGYSGKCDMLSAIHIDQMHQSWRTFAAIINRINLHIICDDSLLDTLKFVSKTQDYQMYGALIPEEMINQDIKDSKAYKTYLDFAIRKATPKKARKFKKVASPSKKLSPVLEEEPTEKPKQPKKPAKKSTTVPTTCVVIKETPSMSVSKKKALAKLLERKKAWILLSDSNITSEST